jgi:hypothetical protein
MVRSNIKKQYDFNFPLQLDPVKELFITKFERKIGVWKLKYISAKLKG